MASSPTLTPKVRFGPFELDAGSGELHRHGTLIKLQPQPLKVLSLLANYIGERGSIS
jgi:DNA-binding winged helix-turn-helix (wHTH) protein